MPATLDDRDLTISVFSPVCLHCVHNTGYRTCKAFTGEIPLEIWVGNNSHTAP